MRLLVGVFAALMLIGCGKSTPTASTPEHDSVIRAGSGPIAFVAQRLAGGIATIELPVPEGDDPSAWRPGFDAIADYQASMLIVLNGAGFEQWADSAALPNSRVVRTADAAGIELIRSTEVTHTHGTEGSHSHGAMNPHTWMSPRELSAQARALADSLNSAMPDQADAIDARLEALVDELAELSLAWRKVDVAGVRFVASHPSYDYLAREMGWEIVNIDLPPEGPITDDPIGELIGVVEADDRTVLVLWESEPDAAIAEQMLADFGIHSVVVSPAEGGPIGAYLDVQSANVDRLARAVAAARGK